MQRARAARASIIPTALFLLATNWVQGQVQQASVAEQLTPMVPETVQPYVEAVVPRLRQVEQLVMRASLPQLGVLAALIAYLVSLRRIQEKDRQELRHVSEKKAEYMVLEARQGRLRNRVPEHPPVTPTPGFERCQCRAHLVPRSARPGREDHPLEIAHLGSPLTSFGRRQGAVDVCLSSWESPKMISRLHANIVRLSVPNGLYKWRLVDNNSLNGVFVNGMRVAEATLSPGDIIVFGGPGDIAIGASAGTALRNAEFVFEFILNRQFA